MSNALEENRFDQLLASEVATQPEGGRTYKPKGTKEQRGRSVGKLLNQHEAALTALESFDIAVPRQDLTRERLRDWLHKLSDEAQFSLGKFPSSRVVIVPPLSTPALVQRIDHKKKISEQGASQIKDEDWNEIKASDWMFAITSARQNIAGIYGDSEQAKEHARRKNHNAEFQMSVGKMLEEYERRYEGMDLGVMPPYGYVPTQMNLLGSKGVVLDSPHTITSLPPPLEGGPQQRVLAGRWYVLGQNLMLTSYPLSQEGHIVRPRYWIDEKNFPPKRK